MRYDTPIYFQKITPGEYDAETGNYAADTIEETLRYAYIDQVEDIDALYEEVIDELKKHNATKAKMEQMQKLMNAAKKK